MPGDPDDEAYDDHCPAITNGSLSFVGSYLGSGYDSGGHRLFYLSVTVYNHEKARSGDAQAPSYTSFKVVCALPGT